MNSDGKTKAHTVCGSPDRLSRCCTATEAVPRETTTQLFMSGSIAILQPPFSPSIYQLRHILEITTTLNPEDLIHKL
jgi:hypothetical protein